MKRHTSLLSALLLGSFTLSALAAHTHAPTPSTWELDVAVSDFGGAPAPKSDTMTVLTDTDKWFKWTDVTVDSSGKTWKTSWSGPQNGTLRPIVGMDGAKASFKTTDDSSHWEMADGSSSDATMVMSPDKKKVTITAVVKTKDGKTINQTLVYDRTK